MALGLGSILSKLLSSTGGSPDPGSLVGSFFGQSKPSTNELIQLSEEERKQRALSFFGAEDYGYPYQGDDAPNILIPEPLVQSTTTFVPQTTEVPEIIDAPRGQVVRGLGNLVLEIERINRNIANIQLALAGSAATEKKYRDQIIKDKQEDLTLRDKLRSQRRADRRREATFKRRMQAIPGVAAAQDFTKSSVQALIQASLMTFVGGILDAFKDATKQPVDTTPIDPSKYSGNIFKDKAFIDEVNRVAKSLGMSPLDLLAVMDFETGGTFSPSIQNPDSLATGLLQFIPSTAKGMGTTVEDLRKMSRIDQMKYVEKYLKNKGLQGASIDDVYMSVLLPAAQGADMDAALFTKDGGGIFGQYVPASVAKQGYEQNKGLDANKDGVITKAEAAAPVIKRRQSKYPSLAPVTTAPPQTPGGPPATQPPKAPELNRAAAPVMPQSTSIASVGPVMRAPIVIDARVQRQLNRPKPTSAFAQPDDVASVEPRLVNTGYESMFAV